MVSWLLLWAPAPGGSQKKVASLKQGDYFGILAGWKAHLFNVQRQLRPNLSAWKLAAVVASWQQDQPVFAYMSAFKGSTTCKKCKMHWATKVFSYSLGKRPFRQRCARIGVPLLKNESDLCKWPVANYPMPFLWSPSFWPVLGKFHQTCDPQSEVMMFIQCTGILAGFGLVPDTINLITILFEKGFKIEQNMVARLAVNAWCWNGGLLGVQIWLCFRSRQFEKIRKIVKKNCVSNMLHVFRTHRTYTGSTWWQSSS